jgi:hypothetical protein
LINPQLQKIQKDRENILRLLVTLPKSYIYDLVYNVYLPANFEESAEYRKQDEDDAMSSVANGTNNDVYDNDEEQDEDDEDEEQDEDDEDEDTAKQDTNEDVQDISV